MSYDPRQGGRYRPMRQPGRQDESWTRQPVRQQTTSGPKQSTVPKERRKVSALYDDFDNLYEEPERNPARKKPRTHRHTGFWTFVLILAMVLEFALACMMAPQLLGRQLLQMNVLPTAAFAGGTVILRDESLISTFNAMRDLVYTDTLANGITIDGVDVGGMTLDEARQAVEAVSATGTGGFKVVVKSSGKSWTLSSKNIPMTRSTDQALRIAWAAGRQTTEASRTGSMTPAQERRSAALMLTSSPLKLSTSVSWDEADVLAQCRKIAKAVTVAPTNASIKSFNFKTRKFTVNADKDGQSLDANALYERVTAITSATKKTGTVTMEPETVKASITQASLEKNLGKISTYTTSTTANKNRNTNIKLSAEAINGTVVKPGATFSFNKTTGQRTAAKGYKEASAISGGTTSPEIGGGVCQTSSTLFNAVARANMEIITRSPHAWPSSYVP